jgi:two-component system response regulator YesN
VYSVLIVDDERRVRQGLADNVDWESFGFRVSGSESNGKRAFEFIEQRLPDVLLTDIRMPVMSGLELMDLVHKKYPSIKMVALSGYDEFEYAQQALKYGVLDYILKPTKISDLRLAFAKVKTILDNEKEKKEREEKLQQQLKEAQPLLREKCLYEIVKGRTEDKNKIWEKINFLGLDIGEKSFCVLLAEVGALSKPDNEMDEQNKQLLMFSIMNIIEEITERYCKVSIFSPSSSSIIILLSDDNIDILELENLKYSIAEKIQREINNRLDIEIAIGMGRAYGSIDDTYVSCNESSFAVKYKLYEGRNSIIDINDVSPPQDISYSLSREKEEALIEHLRLGNEKQVIKILNSIYYEILHRQKLPLDYIQRVCLEILISSSRYISEMGGDFKDIFPENIISFQEISKYETVDELYQWMVEIFSSIIDYIKKTRESSQNTLIENVKQYITLHYAEDVSLKSLAQKFYISPEYLSRLFKKETGENFIEYLTKTRISKAKELLIENKDIKVYEVAEMVGYNDPKYFSRLFIKHTNQYPVSYRDSK